MDQLKTLEDLAVAIENIDNSDTSVAAFDMGSEDFNQVTRHQCGSAACIGGWTKFLNPISTNGLSLIEAVQTLDNSISMNEIDSLCWPEYDPAWKATPAQAAKAIRILDKTGKCDWKEAMSE